MSRELSRGAGGDISMEIDMLAERIFIKHLSRYGKIISEESGEIGEGRALIHIDPIDGSENFISRFPYYGSSVALEIDGEVEVGIVCNFANGDIFLKTKKYLKCAKLQNLKFTDVEINKGSKIGVFERGYRESIHLKRLQKNGIKFRIGGAVALSLTYAHYLDFVIFEGELRDFDAKAALYICENLYKYQYNGVTLISAKRERFFELKKILFEDKE
jgi:myo-inositol-1(or 4)-monophosphatase